jgi:hypothetical protein
MTVGRLAARTVLILVAVLLFVPFMISLMFGALFAGVALVATLIHVAPLLAVILLVYWLFARRRSSPSQP